MGICVGLFLGERAQFLSVAAEGYVKLLKMSVLPYMTVSLISGLGSLDYTQARTIFVRVGGLLVLLWAIALSLVRRPISRRPLL